MIKGLAGAVALTVAAPAIAADAGSRCGTYPAEVTSSANAGSSDCILRDAEEKPLWRIRRQDTARQRIRFTFTEGHGAYTRVIDFYERPDGDGIIRLKTLRPGKLDGPIVSGQFSRVVNSANIEIINRLGSSSESWTHSVGSWDGNDLFIHCETLDMERATREGYSFSTVNISCNQPDKLMPLVSFITGLVGLKPFADGRMF